MTDWWSADPVAEAPATERRGTVSVRPYASTDFWKDDPIAPPAAAENSWGGAAKSAGTGLAKGVAGLVGLPDVVAELGAQGIDKATRFVAGHLGIDAPRPQGGGGVLPTTAGTVKAIESVTGPLYQPQTRTEKFIERGAEFIPGAVLAPGGVVGNAVRYGVIPGVASEAAGQATEGTAYEGPARVGAALAAGGAAALVSRPSTAARALREQLPPGVTQQHVDEAARLIADAGQQGITLSWPEALSQVAQRPVLTNTMRHLEAAPQTEARMAEFFGGRAGQVDDAARQQFGQVAPANPAPSTIGPAVGQAAEGTINDVRGVINRATDPFYRQAEGVRLTPQEMAQVRALPGFEEARAAVRNDPQLNRYVAHLPDDSVGFLDEVRKFLNTAGENATAPVNAQRNMQRAAGYGQDAAAARQIGVNASPEYEIALQVQEQTRRQYLEPLLQGPLGKMAGRDTTTQKAIEALFPSNPLANSADEIATTVSALAQRNPNAARDLVRAHLEGTFNQAARDLQPGANQMGGANFRKALVGNHQQAENLEAAVRALPHGDQIWPGFNRFLEVLEATGKRPNVGSRTAYNAEMLKSQAASGLAGEAAKSVANPLRLAQPLIEKYERYRLGRNLNELADILTNPAAVGQLRAIARMPVDSPAALNAARRITTLSRTASDPVGQSRE